MLGDSLGEALPGPAPPRRAEAIAFFAAAAAAAAERCGVTRLADITGLDRIGLPVWQAVRPNGRALSVHQGKGTTPLAARIGALCEAIESHCAENAPADGPRCRFGDLSPRQRAAEIGDYCTVRDEIPAHDETIAWCIAEDLDGKRHYLPHPLVSLDYTAGLPSPFERISGGLGAGATEEEATRTALFELVERDALGEWQRLPEPARQHSSLALDTVPFGWFQAWRARLEALGIRLDAHQLQSFTGVPAFSCTIGGAEAFGSAWRRFYGSAAHGDPEVALFKALAEAIQSRLTVIAGVRDDILPSYYAWRGSGEALRAAPTGARQWDSEPVRHCSDALAGRLASAGYPQVIRKRLDRDLAGLAVVRVFVPGLGSLGRTRRPPR